MSACSLARPSLSRMARCSSSLAPHWLQNRARRWFLLEHLWQRSVSLRLGMATNTPLVPSMIFKSRTTKALSKVTEQNASNRSLFASHNLMRTSVMTTAILLQARIRGQTANDETVDSGSVAGRFVRNPSATQTASSRSPHRANTVEPLPDNMASHGASPVEPPADLLDARATMQTPAASSRLNERPANRIRVAAADGLADVIAAGRTRGDRRLPVHRGRRQAHWRTDQDEIERSPDGFGVDDFAAAGTPGGWAGSGRTPRPTQ